MPLAHTASVLATHWHFITVYAQLLGSRLLLPFFTIELLLMLAAHCGPDVIPPLVTALLLVVYYVLLAHEYLNVCIADMLLRLHIPPASRQDSDRTSPSASPPKAALLITRHSALTCEACQRAKPFHRLEDAVASGAHGCVGSILFVGLPWLLLPRQLLGAVAAAAVMVSWRSYQHAQYAYTRAGACIETAAGTRAPTAWLAGTVHTAVELALAVGRVPLSVQLCASVLLAALLDLVCSCDMAAVAAVPLGAPPRWPVWHKAHIWLLWKLCRSAVVGTVTLSKRRRRRAALANHVHVSYMWLCNSGMATVLRTALLWPEFRSLAGMAHRGPVAAYTRMYLVGLVQTLQLLHKTLATYSVPLTALHTFVGTPVVGRLLRMLLMRDAKTAVSVMEKIGTVDEVRRFLGVLVADIGAALDVACEANDGRTHSVVVACPTAAAQQTTNYFDLQRSEELQLPSAGYFPNSTTVVASALSTSPASSSSTCSTPSMPSPSPLRLPTPQYTPPSQAATCTPKQSDKVTVATIRRRCTAGASSSSSSSSTEPCPEQVLAPLAALQPAVAMPAAPVLVLDDYFQATHTAQLLRSSKT